ncbi:MAG: sulfatase [Candidatus Latescibacterota bacterium]|nr:sulfatase [Candidatus Latescibacterota bacterium]
MRPNIVYLHSHDTGRYISPYGHAVPTPNVQRLAEQGVLFRRAFCAAPTCSPSRAALLTGQSAHNSGMLGLAHRGFALSDPQQHLAHTLSEAGYQTVLAGVEHVGAGDLYHTRLEVESRQAEEVSAAAVAFLEGGPTEPFFLDCGYHETHLRFPEVSEAKWRYVKPPDPLPDNEQNRRMTAGYHECVRRMDAGHGRVLDALNLQGLADNTLVICTTDHGVAFPSMKCNLTDHGMGVLLMIRGGGGFDGGQVSDAMVSHLDLYPTICELLGLEAPTWLQGYSLLPLIRGEVEQIRAQTFAEVTYHAAYEPQRAVRTDRWKYIRRFDGDEKSTPVLPNCDASPAKEVWLAHGWAERKMDDEQLYDLIFDPNETRNRVADPSCTEALVQMRRCLDDWMQSTDDPLLTGPVPAPRGSTINDKHGRSPGDRMIVAG